MLRGKLRLVINYKPLNWFLSDVKFPLPKKSFLFGYLSNARIFSKFDLKAGFWQLGIKPEDRYKTGFCIPQAHYNWTVMPFGLKTAPSLFQQAMIRIFGPILKNALIYIDDILLFSPDEASHLKLLHQFYTLLKQYGVMLSESKMVLTVQKIDFLGMKMEDGKYVPQEHIGKLLLDFPDTPLTQKEVQQFLGVVNYMSDFIPKLSPTVKPLRAMLKKDAPTWGTAQSDAVRKLKSLVPTLPPLQIPSTGKRILQTDASDSHWSAILLEEVNGTRHVCGYKSGQFKPSEEHYHSTFKEILAVRRGIEKFEFHLIGHKFLVEMDMSAFPRMLEFKQKMIPDPQRLRWAQWFSQYTFEVKHIKGKDNILADMLSRPKKVYCSTAHLLHTQIPVLCMMADSFSDTPPEVPELFRTNTFHLKIADLTRRYQSAVIRISGLHTLGGLNYHEDYPFLTLFMLDYRTTFTRELLWCLLAQFKIAIQFPIREFYDYLHLLYTSSRSYQPESLYIVTFLQWFHPFSWWEDTFQQYIKKTYPIDEDQDNFHVILFFQRTPS